MLIKPTNTIDWDAPVAKVSEPSSGEKANGWDISQKPPAFQYNWFWNLITDWNQFIKQNIGCYSKVLSLSANHTLTDIDNVGTVLYTTGSSNYILTLPESSLNTNRILIVKKIDTSEGIISILPNGTDTINSENNYLISSKIGIILISDGVSNWELLANDLNNLNYVFGNLNDLTTDKTIVEIDTKIQINKLINSLTSNVWSSTGDLTDIAAYLAGAGTQNAALAFGGYDSTSSSITEKFNGLVWTGVSSSGIATSIIAGCGTQNSALAFGSSTASNSTQSFNGSTWTTVALAGGTARIWLGGSGTQNSALSFGGYDSIGIITLSTTEKFNGLTWSSINNLITARHALAGCGTQNAALAAGGTNLSTGLVSSTEKFNGSIWVQSSDINEDRVGLAAAGIQNNALVFGGLDSSDYDITEKFNGITWSVTTHLIEGRANLAGAGTQNSALAIGGDNSSSVTTATTEKFTGELQFDILSTFIGNDSLKFQTKNNDIEYLEQGDLVIDIDIKAYIQDTEKADLETIRRLEYDNYLWTVSDPLNTPRRRLAGAGTQNAALSIGGTETSGHSDVTESFNGIEWSNEDALSVARTYLASSGIKNAALTFGGINSTSLDITEHFNGIEWTVISSSLLTARYLLAGCGVLNASLSFGGYNGSSYLDTVQKFNGATWASTGSLNAASGGNGGCGTMNAALSIEGRDSTTVVNTVEKFNGLTWSNTYNTGFDAMYFASSGTQNNALIAGVMDLYSEKTLKFNGLYWYLTNDLNTARNELAGAGTANSALSFGGQVGTALSAVTEKFNNNIGTVYQDIAEKILTI